MEEIFWWVCEATLISHILPTDGASSVYKSLCGLGNTNRKDLMRVY